MATRWECSLLYRSGHGSFVLWSSQWSVPMVTPSPATGLYLFLTASGSWKRVERRRSHLSHSQCTCGCARCVSQQLSTPAYTTMRKQRNFIQVRILRVSLLIPLWAIFSIFGLQGRGYYIVSDVQFKRKKNPLKPHSDWAYALLQNQQSVSVAQ